MSHVPISSAYLHLQLAHPLWAPELAGVNRTSDGCTDDRSSKLMFVRDLLFEKGSLFSSVGGCGPSSFASARALMLFGDGPSVWNRDNEQRSVRSGTESNIWSKRMLW